jgi:hypothetical protein
MKTSPKLPGMHAGKVAKEVQGRSTLDLGMIQN